MSPVGGDIAGNATAIGRALAAASEREVNLVVFPTAVTTTLPGNAAQASAFIDACARSIDELAKSCHGFTAIIGCPVRGDSPAHSPRDAAAICTGGKVAQWNDCPAPIVMQGARVGIVLGDAPGPHGKPSSASHHMSNAVAGLAAQGVDLLVLLDVSETWEGNVAAPRHPASALAMRYAAPVLCCHQPDASGNADINRSFAFDKHGEPIAMTVAAEGRLLLLELPDVGFITGGRPTTCGGVNWGPASDAHGQR